MNARAEVMTTINEVADGQHLLFSLGDETFGVEIRHVREIVEFAGATPVPMMPPHVKGVMNLRGRVLPIVDLSSRFGRGALVTGRRTSVMIVELPVPGQPPLLVGVLVSGVSEVVTFAVGQVQPPPLLGANLRAAFIAGVAPHLEHFVVLLDLQQVLSVEELSEASHADAH